MITPVMTEPSAESQSTDPKSNGRSRLKRLRRVKQIAKSVVSNDVAADVVPDFAGNAADNRSAASGSKPQARVLNGGRKKAPQEAVAPAARVVSGVQESSPSTRSVAVSRRETVLKDSRPTASGSGPSLAEAGSDDLADFLGSSGPVRPLDSSESAAQAELVVPEMSLSEASDLLDNLLEGPSDSVPPPAKPSVPRPPLESATMNGVVVDTAAEIEMPTATRSVAQRPVQSPPSPSLGSPAARVTPQTSNEQSQQDQTPVDSDVIPIESGTVSKAVPLPPVASSLPPIQRAQQEASPRPVDVPQMIPVPVPQYIPMPVPQAAMSQAQVPEDQKSVKAESAEVKLPNPADVQPAPTTPVVEEESDSRAPEGDSRSVEDRGRQEERDKSLRRFRKLVEKAKADLLPTQEPLANKTPRILKKNIAKLDAIDSGKFDETVAQLGVIAGTQSPHAIDVLRDYAGSRQVRYRQAAVDGLGKIQHASAGIILLDMLQDPVPAVSGAAVTGLIELGFAETIPALVALGRVDGRCRVLMRDQVAELDSDAQEALVDPLKVALKTKGDPVASAFALNLLSGLKGAELQSMYVALTRHKAPELRVAAIEALVQGGQKQSVQSLNAATKDPDPRVRAAAATGLSKISSPKSESLLISALSDEHASVRRNAAQTLVGFDSKAVAAAASTALNSESDPGVVEYLLEIVGKGGTDEALITLRKYLSSDDSELQHRAMSTLRRLRNPKGAKLVAPFLSSENDETRRLAVETVGQLKHKSVLPELRRILRADSLESIRAAAAKSLGELKDAEATGDLEESLHDGRLVRCQAVIALGSIGDKKSVPAILAQLRDSAPEIRYHACNAIAQVGELSDPEPLQSLLEDGESMVRRGAEAALTKLGYKVGQAKLARRFRSVTSKMMPSVVAGALPGGTSMIVAVVLLAGIWFGYTAIDQAGFSSEPDFPVSDVRAIGVSRDGAQVSVARKFNVLEVWDTNAGTLTAQFQSESGGDGILYRQDGNAVILAGAKSFELDTARVAGEGRDALQPANLNNLSTHRVAATPDGAKAILCAASGKATLVDMVSGKQLLTFRVKDFTDRDAITVSPDASLAFVGTATGQLKVFSLEDGKPLGRLDIGQRIGLPGVGVTALVMDPGGKVIAVGTSSGSVVVVDTDKMEVLGKPYEGAGSIVGLTFRGESRQLHVVTSRRELFVCGDDFSGSKKLTTSLSETPEQVAFSADGNVAAFFYAESDQFCVVDLVNDKVLAIYPSQG